jgi:DNA-3-methyladenine glycosylase II
MLLGRLSVCLPFPWLHLLGYLAHRLTPQIERIEAGAYLRQVGKQTIAVTYSPADRQIEVTATGRVRSEAALRNVARLLDLEHDARSVDQHLRRSPLLKARTAKVPGMRPLGAWSPFELCVRTIVGQQVTVAAAGTLMRRLVQRCPQLTPESLVQADLGNIGMPGKRVETIRRFAQAVHEGRVEFDQPWVAVDAALQAVPGFGPWTRAYLAIRLGRDPDAFPASDLGLIRAANVDTPAQLLAVADSWRPYRAYAATYLWAVAQG